MIAGLGCRGIEHSVLFMFITTEEFCLLRMWKENEKETGDVIGWK